jgi:hypothetical protein
LRYGPMFRDLVDGDHKDDHQCDDGVSSRRSPKE